MANPRKPTHLKSIEGTSRKDRDNPSEPVASKALPVAPDYLSSRASEKFYQLTAILVGMGVASNDDSDALGILSALLVEIEEDVVLLESVGRYYVPSQESGIIRAHPAVAAVASGRQRAQALLNEFGLTPAARSKVSARLPAEANPFGTLEAM